MRKRLQRVSPIRVSRERNPIGCRYVPAVVLATAILFGFTPPTAEGAVGRLGGAGAVSPAGSATYSIPIEVAAGMNGLKPDLALVYDSQSGNGLAGIGWALSGFPGIFRCPGTIAVDGQPIGVNYGPTDRFCLDGSPLIMVTDGGIYGGNDVQYRPELYNYQKVTSKGSQGSGPSYFEVRVSDGTTYIYGNDADSRILAPGTTEVRVWALNTVQDKFGNQIQFAYTNPVSGEYVPDEVTWTGTTSGAAPYKLKFTYDDLNSVLPSAARSGYVWGSTWQTTRRLKEILYSFSDSPVHRYTLIYTAGTSGRSQLQSVQKCNGTGTDCLPATTFTWQNGSLSFGTEQSGPTTPSEEYAVAGDIDGDGDTDVYVPSGSTWMVMYADAATGNLSTPVSIGRSFYGAGAAALDYDGDGRIDLAAVDGSGTWSVYLAAGTGCSSGVCNTGIAVAQSLNLQPIDANGDGLSDLLYQRNGASYLRINTNADLGPERVVTLPGQLGYRVREVGDVDGDGRQDVVIVHKTVEFGTPNLYETTLTVYRSFWNTSAQPDQDDFQAVYSDYASGTTGHIQSDPLFLDINGDGLSDLLYKWQGGAVVTVLSRGKPGGWSAPVSTGMGSYFRDGAVAADFNKDGRDDMIAPCSNTSGSNWCAYLSNGTTYSASLKTDIGGPTVGTVTKLVSVDTTGDGSMDFVAVKNTSPVDGWVVRVQDGPHADLLTGITDGLGNTFNPSYHALSNWPYASDQGYSATGLASPPTKRMVRGGPATVVSQVESSTGVGGGNYTTKYAYWNAVQDATGRGVEGFETVKAKDSRDGMLTETVYNQYFPYTGRPKRVTVWNGSNKVTETDLSWGSQVAQDGEADSNHTAGSYKFVHLRNQVEKAFEVDGGGSYNGQLVRTVTRNTIHPSPYDWDYVHGAPRREVVTVDPEVGATITTTTDYTFENLTSAGCLGLPSTVAVKKDDGISNSTRNLAFTYDPGTCRTMTETVGTTAAKQLKTSYTYDSSGRLWTSTEDSGDVVAADRLMTMAYDTTGFRPSSQTFSADGVAYAIGHSWDNRLGLEAGRSNPQGESTGWDYDDFGRLKTETRPAGSSGITYTACSPCWPSNSKYKLRETRSDGSWSESYRDAFDRVVGTASLLNSGTTESRQVFTYNNLGRLVTETLPYRSDSAPFNIDRTYDLIGRPKTESRPVSDTDTTLQSTSWIYNRLATTVTDAESHARTFTMDAEGRLAAVQEPSPGGTTAYGYTPWGELNSVTDASLHQTTTMSYDERGFRTDVVDQDAGASKFEYTVWGELYRFRDARTSAPNWTLTNTYDQLGRLGTRVDYDPVVTTSATSTWDYYITTDVNTDARKGLLYRANSYISVVGSALLYREEHKYDVVAGSQVSLLQTAVTITGAPSVYTTGYTYDTEGRLEHMTYPTTVSGSPRVDYAYTRSYLDTVKLFQNGLPYDRYDLVTVDALGRDTLTRLGTSALDVQTLYDRVNLMVKEIKTGGPSLGTGTQNLAYTWDKVGNLKTRQDKNQTGNPTYLTERFTYDALNRLGYAYRNEWATQNLGYTADGNITSKVMPDGNAFDFTYQTAGKPHAVSKVERSFACDCSTCVVTDNYGYDAAGNMTSRTGASGNRYVTWTAFGKPKQISLGTENCGGDCTTFVYGPDRQLIRQDDKKGSTTRKIFYIGPHFEVEVNGAVTEYRSHGLANGQVVFTQIEDSSGPALWQTYYPLRDHLGSVDKQFRSDGLSTLTNSFDAFGRRRNGDWTNDGSGSTMTASLWNHQGFTGHEMLDNSQLVYMKGRVYDPNLGRFLSRDPLLDDPQMPQSLNPLSYVANTPLSATDPSGFRRTPDWYYDGGWVEIHEINGGGGGNFAFESTGYLRTPDGTLTYLGTTTQFFSVGGSGGLNFHGNSNRGGSSEGGDGSTGSGGEPAAPQDQKPICEGGVPQLIDANITAAVATARVLAANTTDGSMPPIGARRVGPVTSARIAPYEQIAANTDWARVAKAGARLGTAFNVYNVVSGFRSSVADGLYATTDMAVGTALAFVPLAGVPVSIGYSAHGGSKALVNDVRYATGRCRAP